MSPAWDPPALLLVLLGAAALIAWLVLSPPSRRSPLSAALQATAAILLTLALVNAGWRPGRAAVRPRLAVLVDRSASMTEVGS
ncbi:MAG: glutamine amidotransferase, partial [Gemmatimonadota bacterium]